MSSSATATPPRPTAPVFAAKAQPPRAQYVELKGNVHRKLLNRLNLEALANADDLLGRGLPRTAGPRAWPWSLAASWSRPRAG